MTKKDATHDTDYCNDADSIVRAHAAKQDRRWGCKDKDTAVLSSKQNQTALSLNEPQHSSRKGEQC